MTRRLGSGVPRFDRDRTLYALRDNLGKADAYISSAERLIEETPWDIRGDEGDDDENDEDDQDESGDSISRRKNHLEHLIESAKLAVRAAICAGSELDRHRGGA